ncbi:ATG12/APG12 [Lotmaria passim]
MPRRNKKHASSSARRRKECDGEEEELEDGGLTTKNTVPGDKGVLAIPALHATQVPEFQAASLCSSSASSEPYVSPCSSDLGDQGDEAPMHHHESTMAVNSSLSHRSQALTPGTDREQHGGTREAALGKDFHCTHEPTDKRGTSECFKGTPSSFATAHKQADLTNAPSSFGVASSSPLSSPPPPPPPRTHFQYIHSFDYRHRLAAKLRALYGEQSIPVIVEPAESQLRANPNSAPPYESQRVAAETRLRSIGIGRGLLTCLGVKETSTRGTHGFSTPAPLALSASAAAALASPSTRSTLKCVLPASKSVAEVILTLRDRLALDSAQSIFLSVGENDALVPGNSLLGDLYQRYCHRDGFLYFSYLLENTFG